MIKNFNSSVVLTANNPEVILTFTYESGDSPGSFTPYLNEFDYDKVIINGVNFKKSNSFIKTINFNKDINVVSFHIISNSTEDFDIPLKINFSPLGAGTPKVYDITIHNRKYVNANLSEFNSYPTLNQQIEDKSSFMLLRTNPKFSGNIKLVVDSNENMYLDTIKVNSILGKKEYRKQIVSPKGEYANDIRNVFGNMPLGIIHQIGDYIDNFDMSLPKTTFDKQYSYTYSYGARLLIDDLYNESYSLFAPLWINDNIPDYFVVFKLKGTYNDESYDNNNFSNIAKKYLSKSSIVKVWNMKENSQIGEYLRKHIKNNKSLESPLFISFNDFDDNIFNGISIQSGVITSVAEPPYFFNRVKNFTSLNEFISNGFERNNLIMSNLINLEFLFDDNNEEDFSMNRYFGLYLTQNELFNIYYYKENPNSQFEIRMIDDKNVNDITQFLTSNIIFDTSTGLINDKFSNRLFFNKTANKIDRIVNLKEIDGKSADFNFNRVGENIFSMPINKLDITTPFITFSLENKLNSGEHLRVIDRDNNVIYETYGINDDNLNAGESWTYATSINKEFFTIYRTAFSIKGEIKDQIKAISNAFRILKDVNDSVIGIVNNNEDSIGIILNKYLSVAYLQRITSQTEKGKMSGVFNNCARLDDIKVFGRIYPQNFNIIDDTDVFTYYDFEHHGRRNSFRYTFFNNKNADINKHFWSCDKSFADKFLDNMLYQGTDSWYRLIKQFKLTNDIEVVYIQDPFNLDKIMIHSLNNINLINGILNVYSIMPSSINLMGISAVKDFDFNIYDNEHNAIRLKSQYFYNREDDASCNSLFIKKGDFYNLSTRDSYIIISGKGTLQFNDASNKSIIEPYNKNTEFNTYFNTIKINAEEDTTIKQNLLISNTTYDYGYIKNENEEYINDYKNLTGNSKNLKISVITPSVSKWNGLGTDCRNNPIRLWVNPSIFTKDVKSSFLPYKNSQGIFTDEISFPTYKYMSPQNNAWKSYIYYDINDVIRYTIKHENEYETKYETIKNLMFILPKVDFFSKLVYSTHDKSEFFNRSSLLYYNITKNTLDVYINGINISFTIDEGSRSLVNLQNYNKYNFSFISTASRSTSSNSPLELIINENTKTMLLIWYQGTDILDYSRRQNTIIPGKSILSEDAKPYFKHLLTGINYVDKSFIKTPYIVNTGNILFKVNNVYCDINETIYNQNITKKYLQYNNNSIYNYSSILNAYSDNNKIINNIFDFNNTQYNTLDGNILYTITNNPLSYNNSTINYGYAYNSNINEYTKNKNNICNLDILKSLLPKLTVYTIRDNDHMVNYNKNFSPINITINEPRDYKNINYDASIKVYPGWYKPAFNNIFNFAINEDSSLINIIKSDFTLSNTNLVDHNNFKQIWYNTITNTNNINEPSFSDNLNFNMNVKKDFNPFSCIWDKAYYILYTNYNTPNYINGYESPYELPSFFGSKLIKLPKELIFDKWENNIIIINNDTTNNKINLEFLITRKIKDYFNSNIKFTKNWTLPDITNTSNIIEQYIKNTIIPYYSLYNDTIHIEVYTKKYDGTVIYTENDGSFTSKLENFKGSIELNQYNEYIYTIQIDTINNIPSYSYYIKFIIKEK